MKAAKGNRRAESRRRRAIAALAESDPELTAADLVVPADEVRRLVLQIILADEVAPFVRRVVNVIDALKAGRTAALTRGARQSKNRPLAKLLSHIKRAAEDGRTDDAEATARTPRLTPTATASTTCAACSPTSTASAARPC